MTNASYDNRRIGHRDSRPRPILIFGTHSVQLVHNAMRTIALSSAAAKIAAAPF